MKFLRPLRPLPPPNTRPPPPTANPTVPAPPPPPSPVEGAPDTAIAADVSSQQVSQQKQTTAELLAAAEKNLKSVNRALNHDEQAMVSQIKTFDDPLQGCGKRLTSTRALQFMHSFR